jgi:hypothetical protein
VVTDAPRVIPTTAFQHQAVEVGSNASFTVPVSGQALCYQWLLGGSELLVQTQRTLATTNAQPADEGDYTVVVTNLLGGVTAEPARL